MLLTSHTLPVLGSHSRSSESQVRVEGWRGGGAEGWRGGGAEGWRDGGAEGWRGGGFLYVLTRPA